MDKKEKRQIIYDKSVYIRKWTLLDELQLQWILLKVRKFGIVKQSSVRTNVRAMLVKYGRTIEQIDKNVWEIF